MCAILFTLHHVHYTIYTTPCTRYTLHYTDTGTVGFTHTYIHTYVRTYSHYVNKKKRRSLLTQFSLCTFYILVRLALARTWKGRPMIIVKKQLAWQDENGTARVRSRYIWSDTFYTEKQWSDDTFSGHTTSHNETPQSVYLRTAHKQTAPSDMGNSHNYFTLSYILHPSLLTVTVLLQLKMDY